MYRSFNSFVSNFQPTLLEIESTYNMGNIYIKADSELNKVVLLQTLYLQLETLVNINYSNDTDMLRMAIWNDNIVTQLCNQLNIKKSKVLQFLNISSYNLIV